MVTRRDVLIGSAVAASAVYSEGLGGLALVGAPPQPLRASSPVLNTLEQIKSAVGAAGTRATLTIAPGRYGPLEFLSGRKFDRLQLAAADPSEPPIFQSDYDADRPALRLYECEGVSFENIAFESQPLPSGSVAYKRIIDGRNARRIELTRCIVRGVVDTASGARLGWGWGNYQGCSLIKFERCRFESLARSLALFAVHQVTVERCDFFRGTDDGINVSGNAAGGATEVLLAWNMFSDWHSVGASHSDAIQIDCSAARHSDLVIRNNFVAGDPQRPLNESGASEGRMQGIFVTGKMGAESVKLLDNELYGTNYAALQLGPGTDFRAVEIRGNKVYFLRGIDKVDRAVLLVDADPSEVQLSGNLFHQMVKSNTSSGSSGQVTRENGANRMVTSVDQMEVALGAWRQRRETAAP